MSRGRSERLESRDELNRLGGGSRLQQPGGKVLREGGATSLLPRLGPSKGTEKGNSSSH